MLIESFYRRDTTGMGLNVREPPAFNAVVATLLPTTYCHASAVVNPVALT